jgi:hypothetical protein
MTRSKPFGQSLPQQQTADENIDAAVNGAAPNAKLVDLIANGTHAVPAALSDRDAEQLCFEVSRIRRSRLISWIARCLANRLLDERRADRKGPAHDPH